MSVGGVDSDCGSHLFMAQCVMEAPSTVVAAPALPWSMATGSLGTHLMGTKDHVVCENLIRSSS